MFWLPLWSYWAELTKYIQATQKMWEPFPFYHCRATSGQNFKFALKIFQNQIGRLPWRAQSCFQEETVFIESQTLHFEPNYE